MTYKIGETIEMTKDFEIESFGGRKFQVKEGDKGVIDSQGNIHYISGAATGMIQPIAKVELDGYDHKNIATRIFHRLNYFSDLSGFMEDYEISQKDFIAEIEDVLTDIL